MPSTRASPSGGARCGSPRTRRGEYSAALQALASKYGNDLPGPGRRYYITMMGLVPKGRR